RKKCFAWSHAATVTRKSRPCWRSASRRSRRTKRTASRNLASPVARHWCDSRWTKAGCVTVRKHGWPELALRYDRDAHAIVYTEIEINAGEVITNRDSPSWFT